MNNRSSNYILYSMAFQINRNENTHFSICSKATVSSSRNLVKYKFLGSTPDLLNQKLAVRPRNLFQNIFSRDPDM